MKRSEPRWFTATLVVEFQVSGFRRSVVHLNTVLVRATSSADAFRGAMDLGRNHRGKWLNPDGRLVTCRFRGLHYLDLSFDPPKHGAEVMWTEHLGLHPASISKLVQKRSDLGLFTDLKQLGARPKPRGRHNIASKEVLHELLQGIARDRRRKSDRRSRRHRTSSGSRAPRRP